MLNLLTEMTNYIIGSLFHNSIYLIIGILIAVILKVYVNTEKVEKILLNKTNASIPASVAFGAFTPLCACGTMAVIIAMLSTTLPLGPIMAFLTSSPLMSPDGFVLIAGIIDLRFAIALTLASIIIGLGSGYITHLIETNTGFLKNQIRFSGKKQEPTCGCTVTPPAVKQTCCMPPLQMCCSVPTGSEINHSTLETINSYMPSMDIIQNMVIFLKKIKWRELSEEFFNIGVKQILFYYSIFVGIGFLINRFVPTSIIVTLFSPENIFSVPLAALIGLPIYVNGESAIPLINSLLAGGASGGAMLAFLITGPGTSAGVIAGIATILKKRAVILYVLFLLIGGISLGYLYDLLLVLGV